MARRRVRRPLLDPQQHRLYAWEGQFKTIRTGAPLTQGRLHRLVSAISKLYGIKKPRLRAMNFKDRDGFQTFARSGSHDIEFSRKHAAHTPLIVAHEMAHVIQEQYGMYPQHSCHGKQFAGILAYILHRFSIMPSTAVLPSMRAAKVRYFHPYNCRPVGLKNWYKKC